MTPACSAGQCGDAADPRDRRLAPCEDGLEHDEHDGREDQRARDRVKENRRAGASTRRTGVSLTTAAVAISRARRCKWMRSLFTGVCPRPWRGEHVVHSRLQLVDAAAPHGDGLDDGDAKLGFEALRIEFQSVAAREIDHVERDNGRKPQLDQLKREAKMVVEVRGVEDDDQRVGLPLAFAGRAARRG